MKQGIRVIVLIFRMPLVILGFCGALVVSSLSTGKDLFNGFADFMDQE